jgi:putative ABC transport system permease protein
LHEIGVRKAIGATKRQILGQFIAEAMVLSLAGGIIGIAISYALQYFIGLFTDIQPIITWQVAASVAAVTLGLGIFFGTIPAIKAARKDPIEALRHE